MKRVKIQKAKKLKCFYVWCKKDEEIGGVLVHAISESKARYYAWIRWIGFNNLGLIDLSVRRSPDLDNLPINLENVNRVLSWDNSEYGKCPYKNDYELWREFECNCEICSKYKAENSNG